MSEQPPPQLVALLERLGLARAEQVAQMARRVRRLARDLPQFESVWVDALAQARILTPFQAAELNAGRGDALRVGPYLLRERLSHPYYVATFRAQNVDSQQPVRLAVIDNSGRGADGILHQLESLAKCSKRSDEDLPAPSSLITDVGVDAGRTFAASPWIEGQTAAEWMVHHGRFPPEVVLEIARAMLAGLVDLENAKICHADVSVASLILGVNGDVVLAMPGLRGILRPEEGFAHAALLPEAYDGLAPERISAGSRPNGRSDIFACGCVWWHLLCGRSPLAGGSSLTKLRAAQAAEVCDVRRHAPDVPAALASAISTCLEREPSRRPESMARLAAMLGPPTRSGKQALGDCLAAAGRPTVRWPTTVRKIRKSRRTPFWLAGAACCLAAAVAIFLPLGHGRSRQVAMEKSEVRVQGSGFRVQDLEVRSQRPEVALADRKSDASVASSPPPLSSHAAADCKSPVVPAGYQQNAAKPQDVVLGSGKAMPIVSLHLQANQCVRAAPGKRAVLLIPGSGWTIDEENIRFENIDFVRDATPDASQTKATEAAIVQLCASRAEFRCCAFRGQAATTVPVAADGKVVFAPAAICWVHPLKAAEADIALSNGRLRLAACVFDGVGVGVDCRMAGALAIELSNTLCLNAGPLVRLDHCPQSDEPVSLVLSQVTLCAGGPLLECVAPHVEEQPGEISVLATACAFAPRPGEPLVRLRAAELPGRLLAGVRWAGQGSLVAPRCRSLRCADRTAKSRPWTSRRFRLPDWCEAKSDSPGR